MDLLEAIIQILEVILTNKEFVTLGFVIIAIFTNVLIRVTERREMRPIAAFDDVTHMIGTSIEAKRSLHVSIGSSTIGDRTTMLALLGSEFIYYATREVAVGDAPPLFTMSDAAAIPLSADTLRRAYEYENRTSIYNALNFVRRKPISSRWYPSGQRSLAFAAALMTMQTDDNVSGNLLVGRYGVELSLILDAAYRNNVPSVAGSDDLEGQAIAYAMADGALIGEEVLTASAYLGEGTRLQKRNFAIDLLRGLVVATIIGFAIYNLLLGS